jgi:two-component system cell cycle sensor histidine kinase/response regulator CckA
MAAPQIMVVEDESIISKDIQYTLKNLGYGIAAVAFSGKEAIEKAKETRPDLVLMDIVLKGEIDGVETAEQIHGQSDVPIIYLSAYNDEKTLQRAKITEPYGYLLKPFQERELHTTIEMALYKYRMEKKLREREQWYATTLKSIGDAVIATDTSGKVTYVNPIAEALTGWKQREAIDKPLTEIFNLISEETRRKLENPISKVVREKVTVGLENHSLLIAKDGKEVPIDDSAAPIKDDRGVLMGAVMVFRDITNRKKAEKALRKSHEELERRVEERTTELLKANEALRVEVAEHRRVGEELLIAAKQWRATFDGISDIVSLLDMEGRVLRCNKAMTHLIGKPFSEILNRPYWEIIYGKSAPIENCPVLRVKQSLCRETALGEMYGRWFNIAVDPVFNEARCLIGSVHIMSDVTERMQAEEALRLFEKAIDNLQLGLTITDSHGKIIYTNPAEASMHGYQAEELIGKDVRILAPREIWDPLTVEQLLKMKSWKRESINIRKDGSTFPVHLLSVVVPNVPGDALGVITTCEDITERKKTEGALRRSEEKHRTILENIQDGYLEVDLAGNFTFVNNAECRNLGYTTEELIGMSYRQYTDETTAKKLYHTFNEVYRTGESAKVVDVEVIRKDGTKALNEISASLITDSEGKTIGFRGISRDITERRRAEEERLALQEQLRQSQKMEAIGKLAGGVAHDFNNLLTVIKGYSELILNSLDQNSRLRQDVQEILNASERASSLTRQLLAFSRKHIIQPRVLDLNAHVSNMDKMLRRMIGEDIELVTLLAKDLGRIKADPGQIEQVILNLAVNAKDAMLKGGKLTIETANAKLDGSYARSHIGVTPGRYVMLSVSDTGVGMTPEVKERIFEPFFSTKEKAKGTGLGLSTVYGIIQQSGGNVWVYSEPGVGTTFKIYLPMIEEGGDSIQSLAVSTKPPQGSETILLVEDEEMVRKLACTVLQKYGYTVLEAPNGEEALRIIEGQNGNPVHLMVTDVVMPGMSGRQLADRLASLWPETKVLYMSGYTDNAIVHHGVLEPGIAYIQKPFAPDALASKVREILDEH